MKWFLSYKQSVSLSRCSLVIAGETAINWELFCRFL